MRIVRSAAISAVGALAVGLLHATSARAQPAPTPWGGDPMEAPDPRAASRRRPAPPPPSPESGPDYSVATADRVSLLIESSGRDQSVVVERRVTETNAATRVRSTRTVNSGRCITPCRLFVPPGVVIVRSEGPGLRSAMNEVEVPAQGLRIRVRAGSPSLYNLGTGFVAVGATTLVVLAAVALVYQLGASSGTGGPPVEAALGTSLAAGALLAGGIPLMWLNRTGVEVIRARPTAAADLRTQGVILGAAWTF